MGLFSKIKRSVSRVGSGISSAVRSASSSISSAVGSVSAGVRNFVDSLPSELDSIGSKISGFAGTVVDGVDSFNDWENIAMGALNGLSTGNITGAVAGVGSAIAGNALNERAKDKAEKEELEAIAKANEIQRQIDEKTRAYNKASAEYNQATKKFESAVVNSARSSSSVGVGSVKYNWKVIYNKFTEKLKSSILVNNGLSSDSSTFNNLGLVGSSVSSAVNTKNAK